MKRCLVVLAALLSIVPFSVAAETVPPPPPHDPLTAICRINEVAQIFGLRDLSALPDDLAIYSENAGRIDNENTSALISLFEPAERKNRDEALIARSVGLVVPSSVSPVYAVDLNRGRWGAGSIWLVWFHSNKIVKFKEAPELYPIAARGDVYASSHHCGAVTND